MWILIIWAHLHGGMTPIMQQFPTKDRCEYVKQHLENYKPSSFGFGTSIATIECFKVPDKPYN